MKETLLESARAYSRFAKWHAEFSRGRSSYEDWHHRGRLAISLDEETVEKVNKLVVSNRQLLVGCIVAFSGISTGRVYSILTKNLLTNKVSALQEPRMLSDVQTTDRVEMLIGQLRLFNQNSDNFLSRFLPRNAMLARYQLSSCVRLSQAGVVSKRLYLG